MQVKLCNKTVCFRLFFMKAIYPQLNILFWILLHEREKSSFNFEKGIMDDALHWSQMDPLKNCTVTVLYTILWLYCTLSCDCTVHYPATVLYNTISKNYWPNKYCNKWLSSTLKFKKIFINYIFYEGPKKSCQTNN